MYKIIYSIFIIFLTAATMLVDSRPTDRRYIRGCYYTNWAQYRPSPWTFAPESYEPGLCTHLFYAFVVMKEDFTLRAFEWNDEDHDGQAGMYRRVVALRQKQPDLKVLLSFGGYVFSQKHAALLKEMATKPANRRVFIDSIVGHTRRWDFDGFDLDWEYPDASTKTAYTALVTEIRRAFEDESQRTGRPRLLFTAAVAAGIDRISAGYDGRAIADSFDFLNVMSYDLHGSWERTLGFCAPLIDRKNDRLSVISAMTYWNTIQKVPKEKLIVGFATYGRGWAVPRATTPPLIGSPTNGASAPRAYTREDGVAAYYEICDMIENGRFVTGFDSLQRVPFVFKEDLWFGYDDVRSFNEKLHWLTSNGFGGAFVWALDLDDFHGRCGSSNGLAYPLINAIRTQLRGDVAKQQSVGSDGLDSAAARTGIAGEGWALRIAVTLVAIALRWIIVR